MVVSEAFCFDIHYTTVEYLTFNATKGKSIERRRYKRRTLLKEIEMHGGAAGEHSFKYLD